MRTRDLIGRTIVAVDMQKFHTGRKDRPFSFKPVFTLDNGKMLTFGVDETEVGEYGIDITVWSRKKKRAEA